MRTMCYLILHSNNESLLLFQNLIGIPCVICSGLPCVLHVSCSIIEVNAFFLYNTLISAVPDVRSALKLLPFLMCLTVLPMSICWMCGLPLAQKSGKVKPAPDKCKFSKFFDMLQHILLVLGAISP